MKPLLSVRDLAFAYGSRPLLQDINFTLFPGDNVALLGANGAGKTTLLKLCAGLLRPQRGEVSFMSVPLKDYNCRELARNIALVPQELQVTFDFSVWQFVEQGRTPHLRALFTSLQEKDRHAVWEAMEYADVAHLAERKLSDLSGGERQRVKIALALAQQPRLLLLDEPTQHLDAGRQAEIFAILRRLNQLGIAIVAAIHDLGSALEHFTTGILISPGSKLVWGPIHEVVTPARVQQVFGVPLLQFPAALDHQRLELTKP